MRMTYIQQCFLFYAEKVVELPQKWFYNVSAKSPKPEVKSTVHRRAPLATPIISKQTLWMSFRTSAVYLSSIISTETERVPIPVPVEVCIRQSREVQNVRRVNCQLNSGHHSHEHKDAAMRPSRPAE